MTTFITGKGSVVQVGLELGKGGEGSVYELQGNSRQVVKIYHRIPNARKQIKLGYMAATADEQLLSYAAWPQETLHHRQNGPIVGFLMPRVTARTPIHVLYSPAHRRQDYPKAAWDFLLFVARNTAAAFSTLHSHGHVLADVNQGNVMAGHDSKVMLIDCDSFQINANGEIHLCEVGVSHFTPPELQGLSSFHGVKRTVNHDNFGLALLIFHMLFGGRHPYSGVPLRKDVGESLESDIRAFRFAYASDAQSRGFSTPPKSIPLSLVPDTLTRMFESAFTERGASGGRPTAQQWVSALDAVRSGLRKCDTNSMHIFPHHLGRCPWCELEGNGVLYFVDLGVTLTGATGTFVIARVWAMIDAIPAPSQVPIPNITAISATPAPLPPGLSGSGGVVAARVLIIVGALGLLVAAPKTALIVIVFAVLALVATGSDEKPERIAERRKRAAAIEEARKAFDAIVNRVRRECGPDQFAAKKQDLARLRDEYQRLPATLKDELEKLHATAEARQRHRFLDRCFLDSAEIPGVGPAKKAALRSFGIETAADVDWRKVESVRGFGEVLTRAVVDWRKSCERRFIFNPGMAVTESDKNAVRAKIAARTRQLELALSSGVSDLQRIRQESATTANALSPLMNSAAARLAQAQADMTLM